ncbi:hypothetical protein ASPWEDRAFT_28951 [Aspergillus wentii DTO 134E9]|uniref:Uncharacterized protein n=1 Tax=Aspergillus wentii DTO 134E9 TaxID=1073089 RepID=A0A1L9RFQ7_ASPWE|nr:uncharacterized protein ASPWEDRAFT_28951 [Aspergillus wentii DTO 134E9]KAI9925512.1 hypothetical protein MW887_005893 [Aspergillus wentii]OJJ33752.1 hypothetical protein ASPWEDRAFT_28951 [Aspergillus wentii DTO 134E9]
MIIAAIALATSALAAPAPNADNGFKAQITFIGAADASFSQEFPTDGTSVDIHNPLSISHISSLGGATCTFHGIDGSVTTVVGRNTVDVGPPQTQVSGSCHAL